MSLRYRGFSILAALLVVGASGAAFAQVSPPVQNIGSVAHPNLANAQAQLRAAYDSISVAQQATGAQLGGHAERAKVLIDQASAELKAGAATLNSKGIRGY